MSSMKRVRSPPSKWLAAVVGVVVAGIWTTVVVVSAVGTETDEEDEAVVVDVSALALVTCEERLTSEDMVDESDDSRSLLGSDRLVRFWFC